MYFYVILLFVNPPHYDFFFRQFSYFVVFRTRNYKLLRLLGSHFCDNSHALIDFFAFFDGHPELNRLRYLLLENKPITHLEKSFLVRSRIFASEVNNETPEPIFLDIQ